MPISSRITIRIPEDLRSQLDNEAEELGISISKLLRTKLKNKNISKPKIFINHNNVITFEDLAKAKIIYEDVLI